METLPNRRALAPDVCVDGVLEGAVELAEVAVFVWDAGDADEGVGWDEVAVAAFAACAALIAAGSAARVVSPCTSARVMSALVVCRVVCLRRMKRGLTLCEGRQGVV